MIEVILSLLVVAVVGNSIGLYLLFRSNPKIAHDRIVETNWKMPVPPKMKAFARPSGKKSPLVNDDAAAWRRENEAPRPT
jgi:hypothetical protein